MQYPPNYSGMMGQFTPQVCELESLSSVALSLSLHLLPCLSLLLLLSSLALSLSLSSSSSYSYSSSLSFCLLHSSLLLSLSFLLSILGLSSVFPSSSNLFRCFLQISHAVSFIKSLLLLLLVLSLSPYNTVFWRGWKRLLCTHVASLADFSEDLD